MTTNNACKACAFGMGGQRGARTNELGQFPQICRKSLQAESSDTQAPIPEAVFSHPLDELAQLSGRELEHLGRLNTVLHKGADSDHFEPVTWEAALTLAARRFQETDPGRSFFYTSGRSSNEAGFVLQLMARLYGTNNVNNCSYYCHQATSVGLQSTVGTGTSTIDLEQLAGADLVFVIGANPSSNHPRFLTVLKGILDRGGRVVVINPAQEPGLVRFTGGGGASEYVQPRIGSDPWLFQGLAKAVLEAGGVDGGFVDAHTEGFSAFRSAVEALAWEDVTSRTGVSVDRIRALAAQYVASQRVVFAWGMGITHHEHGSQNVEAIANLALLRGMVGKPAAGLLPLRGHSNIQGMGTVGVKPTLAAEVLEQLERRFGVALPRSPGLDTLACLEAAAAGTMDAALLLGGNLYSATPNSAWAEAALKRIGFKLFFTTTLNRGHVMGHSGTEVLIWPVAARDEEQQPTTQESMFNFVRLSDGGPVRLDNVRSEVELICDLAQRVLPPGPVDFAALKSHRRIHDALAAAVPGLAPLAGIVDTKREFHVEGRLLRTPRFPTPSGRARFAVKAAPDSVATSEFPFVLASVRSEGQFNSIVYDDADKFRKTETRWCVLMNPDDIEAMGLGGRADVRSATGVMRAVTVYPFQVPRGNALAYYPEANVLVGTRHDSRSHTPAFKSTAVAISPSPAPG